MIKNSKITPSTENDYILGVTKLTKKVYLVTIDEGSYDDYHWWIDSIYDSAQKAEQRKTDIQKEFEIAKLDYLNKYGRTYEQDNERNYLDELLQKNEDLYDKTIERLYEFERENPTLEYNSIEVEEREVL